MSNQPGITWRFGQTGAEDLKSKLAQLHDEFAKGQIGLQQYGQGKRDLSRDTRALTNEMQVETNVFKANHPAILEATQAMSIFGSVAHTVLSVTNAINLATLTQMGQQDQLSNINIQIAESENKLARMRQAGLQDTAAYQLEESKLGQLRNELANKQREFAQQAFQNAVTTAASFALVASTVIQSVPKIVYEIGVLKDAITSAQFAETFGIWSTAVGGFATGVLLPLAVAVAAFYGAYELIRMLNPKYDASMKELQGIIMNNWHVDELTAFLVAPFVGAYLGFAQLEDQITEQLYNFINTIINAINTVPDAVNKAFGRIVIPTIQNLLPPGFGNNGQNSFYNQAIKDLNIAGSGASTGTASGLSSGTAADLQKKTASMAEQLVNIWTTSTNPKLDQGHAIQSLGNQTLVDINANTRGIYNYAQQQLQATQQSQQAQADIKSAITQGIASQSQKLEDLKKQYQDALAQHEAIAASHAAAINANGSQLTASDFPDIMSSIGNLNSIQSQISDTQQNISQLQSKATMLDNATSGLTPILQNLGLSADTGIGSIISGALGDYAGPGGAGINEDQLKEFVKTHDYGIFTQAAMQDNGVAHVPTRQEQIAAWMKSTGGSEADAQYALGYTKGSSSGSSNYKKGSGAFWGLPGQYGVAAAAGYDGMVTTPTIFLAGEAGPEHVAITPSGGGKGKGDININIYNAGSLIGQRDVINQIRQALKDDLKSAGFNR